MTLAAYIAQYGPLGPVRKSALDHKSAPVTKAAQYPAEVLAAWDARQCFICEAVGPCRHREIDVEEAILCAHMDRRIFRENRLAHLRAIGKAA